MATEMPLVGHSLAIFISSIVMLSISVIAVLLRCFARLYVVRSFGLDDVLMVAALAIFLALTTCCIIGSMNGIGHKYEEFTSLVTYKKALLFWWLGQMLYIWASAVAKISIAVALLRLAVKKAQRMALWVIISVVTAIGLMFWLVLLLDCRPIPYFWNRVDLTLSGTCLPNQTLLNIAYFYSSVTILCDLSLGFLPVILVWKLQMNHRTKVAVGGILSLGAICSIAVIIRLPFLHFYADSDFLYSTYQIAIWSVIETGLGITAGSLMTLRPLFRWLLDSTPYYQRNAHGSRRRAQNYPLSSSGSHELKQFSNPKYWRPDIDPDKTVINSVSSPRSTTFVEENSSQEALNAETRTSSIVQNRVTVQKTFARTVSEREIR